MAAGKREKIKLTKRSVDAATPEARQYVLYDRELPLFGLRVSPGGAKSYVVEYRPHGGGRRVPTRRLTIGSAAKMTAEQARREAGEIFARVRLGEDPAARRSVSRATPTLAQFAETFIAEACVPPRVKPRTKALYSDNLRRLCAPIAAMKLDAITGPDIARLHRKIGKATPTAANNVLVTLGSLFRYARQTGALPKGHDPLRGAVERFKMDRRERFLTTAEMSRLGDVLREAETVGLPWALNEKAPAERAKHRAKSDNRRVVVSDYVTAAIRLLLFTGCRRSEILNLRWPEVDTDRGLLLLPDSKTGRKTVVLNLPALDVLASIPRVGAFVIAGRAPVASKAGKKEPERPRTDLNRGWERIRRCAGLDGTDGKPQFRLHDFRHSFASLGVGEGMGLPIVGKLLGHTQAATTARYAHLDADPVRRASEAIGAQIAAAMKGKPPEVAP